MSALATGGAGAPHSPPQPMSAWKRLGVLFRPDRSDLIALAVFSLVTGGLLLATPLAVQALVNFVALGAALPSLVVLTFLLFGALATGALVFAIQSWIVEILQRRIFVRLTRDVASRLPRLSWRVRDQYHQPELVNRVFDVVTIQKVGSVLLLDGLASLLSFGVGASVLAFYHPILLAFDVGLLVLSMLLFFLPVRAGIRSAKKESTAKYEIVGWLEELARHRVTFKAAGCEDYVQERSMEVASAYIDARRGHYRLVFGQILSAQGLQVIANTALLGIGGWLVIAGELSLGQLVAANILVALVVSSVAKLGTLAEKFYDLMAAVDKVGKLLDLDVENGTLEPATAWRQARPARLEVKSVVLPGEGAQLRRSPISLTVEPGRIFGVAGVHGAGKSTLLDVLYRLREPKSGSIMIDGTHYADIGLKDYRSRVALVTSPELIETDILENVSLGRPGVELQDVQAVLSEVDLLEEVQGLAEGLRTRIRPSGAPLSPGQQARLVIARALVTGPRLLLIDEVLELLSERRLRAVIDALRRGREERTIIVASDRREVLELCDEVLDLSKEERRS